MKAPHPLGTIKIYSEYSDYRQNQGTYLREEEKEGKRKEKNKKRKYLKSRILGQGFSNGRDHEAN